MKFFEFAQILYSLIGGEKYLFTIDLLKAGLNVDGVDYIKSLRSDAAGKSRIRKLLSGKNDITEIAPNIINSFHQNLFIDYIIETIDESKYPELCKKFENETFKMVIKTDDVPQRLAEIYEEILNKAANGKSASNALSFYKNDFKLLSIIDSILINLIGIGRKIAEFKNTGVAENVRYAKLKDLLHSNFEQLITLSNSLSKSNEAEDSPIVEDIVDSVMSLEENNFILTTSEYMIESINNYHIHRLSSLLSQLKQNL